MTLFAGIVSLDAARHPPERWVAQMSASLSRHPADRPHLIRGPGFALAHVGLGILEGEGMYVDSAGRVSLLAGAPLLVGSQASNRRDQLVLLHEAAGRDDLSVLRESSGTFCTAYVDPAARVVKLATDPLGVRPIYYAFDGGFLYFSTAMRVLEELPPFPKNADLVALAQIVSLAFTFGGATPYASIRSLEAGQILEVRRTGAQATTYWRWDDVGPVERSEQAFGAALFDAFEQAVARRLGQQSSCVSFLSGGLDSRLIVACLKKLGPEVHTLNFAPHESEDLVLGRLMATELATRHFEATGGPLDFWDRMVESHAQWLAGLPSDQRPAHPAQIWTGFGGETVIAPISLSPEVVAQLRAHRFDQALKTFLSAAGAMLPTRVFAADLRARVTELFRGSVRNELEKRSGDDYARRFYLFLLLNEERGQLVRHHEDIDLRRIEFVLPFLDARFVQVALTYRLDEFLRHHFYHRWLDHFPPAVKRVAWQVYPGHEPCPIPAPPGLRWQWHGWYTEEEERAAFQQAVADAARDLRNPLFPREILSRSVLWLAIALSRLGVRRYAYLLKAAREIVRYAAHASRANVPLACFLVAPEGAQLLRLLH